MLKQIQKKSWGIKSLVILRVECNNKKYVQQSDY